MLIRIYRDDLLLKSSQLKALGSPLKHNHQSLFHWIEGKKPVVAEEDDWILHEDDLVPLSYVDHLESSFWRRPLHTVRLANANRTLFFEIMFIVSFIQSLLNILSNKATVFSQTYLFIQVVPYLIKFCKI